MVRYYSCVIALVMLFIHEGQGQFKSQVSESNNVSSTLMQGSAPSVMFGLFDPSRFEMRHMFSMSYQSGGGEAFSLGTYTNSMRYQFAENLHGRADVSLSYSPYSTFSRFGGGKNDISAIHLSRAELNYKPWENVMVQFQYRQLPYGYYSPFSSPWYRETGF